MSEIFTVGGEVDVDCNKCKLTLAHTILAMVDGVPARVKCNTCGSEHAYRVKRKVTAGRRTRASRPSGPAEAEATWQRLLGSVGGGPKRRYNMYEAFDKEEIVDHPAFGPGVVTDLFGTTKIEVTFRTGPKILVHRYRG